MDVEFPLIKSELEAIDVQLLDAERTLFWNSEGTKAALIAPRAERGREGTGAGGGGVQPAWHLEFAVRLPGTGRSRFQGATTYIAPQPRVSRGARHDFFCFRPPRVDVPAEGCLVTGRVYTRIMLLF